MGKVVITQAVPGAGKSTFTEKHWPGAMVVSADHFFMVDGEYKFDPTKISDAHAECLRKFTEKVSTDYTGTVVVDNTNIHLWEMAPYVALANAYGWDVEIHSFKVHASIAGPRNSHGVPQEVVERMDRELESPLPFWGKSFTHFWVDNGPDDCGWRLGDGSNYYTASEIDAAKDRDAGY